MSARAGGVGGGAGAGPGGPHTAPPRTDDLSPLPTTALRLARAVASVRYSRRYRIETHGAAYVPADGPVLLVPTRAGHLDGAILAVVAPRPVHRLVAREVVPGRAGWLLGALGQVPMSRGRVDPAAVRRCVRALRDGRVLAVDPHDRRVLAYLPLVTGAPVVPVAVLGARLAGRPVRRGPPKGTRVVVAFGRAQRVAPEPWPRRRVGVDAMAERLRAMLATHVAATVASTGVARPDRAPDRAEEGTR